MKEITAYKSDNGIIESTPIRAIAYDVVHHYDRVAHDKAIGTSANGKTKIDWHIAMELLERPDIIEACIAKLKAAEEQDKDPALSAEEKFYSKPDETVEIGNGSRGPMIPVKGRKRDSGIIQTMVIPEDPDPAGLQPYLDEAKDRIAKREVFIPKEQPYQDDRGKWVHGKPRPGGWDPV